VDNVNNTNGVTKNADSEKVLMESIATLPKEMVPERDLWTGIEHAISTKKQQPQCQEAAQEQVKPAFNNVHKLRFPPMAWAASVTLAVLISWQILTPLLQNTVVEQIAQQPTISDDLVNFMEQNFHKQKQTMLVSFGQPNLATLSTEMQNELAKLADARKMISKALLTDKSNVDLLNLLDFTQQQELKLLEQLYRQYQVI
jgi:negative regulator of sigma E activity